MKEARNGLFTETPSLNGNGRLARCYGFTVNVRVLSFYYSRISNRDSVYSGVRKERAFVRGILFLFFLMTDIFD